MKISDRFKSIRLRRKMAAGNFLDRIRDLESSAHDRFMARQKAKSLDALSERTGTILVDAAISRASGVEVSEPTDTAFTGVAMGGDGWSFSSVVWHFIAVAAGVLQVGINYLGQLIAGAGAVTLDVDGLTLQDGDFGASAKIKWKDGSSVLGQVFSSLSSAAMKIESWVAGVANKVILFADGDGSGSEQLAQLTVGAGNDGGTEAHTKLEINGGEVFYFGADESRINGAQNDVDTKIFGVSTTPIATFDAGLEAVGFGGAAESGYKVKVTGKTRSTDDIDAAAGINVGSATGAGTGDVKGSGELIMSGTGASSVGGAFAASNLWYTIFKTANESKTSDASIAADTILKIVIPASKNATVRGTVFFRASAAGDIQYRINSAGSPTEAVVSVEEYLSAGGAKYLYTSVPTTTVALTDTAQFYGVIRFEARLTNDGSPRIFSFQWAQNTSSANATTVLAGSSIEYKVVD